MYPDDLIVHITLGYPILLVLLIIQLTIYAILQSLYIINIERIKSNSSAQNMGRACTDLYLWILRTGIIFKRQQY